MVENMDEGTVLHKGYLVLGEEILIKGGLDVQFQKKKRRFFVLYHLGESNLLLQGYRDEKAFRKGSEARAAGRHRKNSTCPLETVSFVTSLKVHKVEMKAAENALIVVSGALPTYFCTDNKEALEEWYKVFMDFASDEVVKKRRSPKLIDLKDMPQRTSSTSSNHSNRTSMSSQEEVFTMDNEGRDSGYIGCSSSSRPRSFDSDRSSTCSDEHSGSGKYFPRHFIFDEDHPTTTASSSPSQSLSSSPSNATTLGATGGIDWRKSMFIRTHDGSYVERLVDQHESGIFETIDDDDTITSTEALPSAFTQLDPLYDRLPPSMLKSAPTLPPKSAPNSPSWTSRRRMPSIQETAGSVRRTNNSFDSPDMPDGSSAAAAVSENTLGESDAERVILDDDGSKHSYMNMRRPSQRQRIDSPSSSMGIIATTQGETRLSASPQPLPARQRQSGRKVSLGVLDAPRPSELTVTSRGRADTLPIMPQASPESESPYSVTLRERPLPKPELDRSSDIETLLWEQTRESHVKITLDKQDVEDALALVEIRGQVWIAGWKTGEHQVFGKLRVGDQLVQVNDQVVLTADWANTFIRTSSKDKITLVIKRLPHAHIVNCTRVDENTPWGIELKANEIVNVSPGPAMESGLTPKAMGAYSSKPSDWVITEIVHMPVKLNCGKHELERYLKTCTLELPLIVQPKDFITDLAKGLHKMKRGSLYHVGWSNQSE